METPDPVRELLPLSPSVFYILFALAEGEKHGYAIMKQVESVSDGQFTMGPATLYTNIQRLLELGLIEETSTSSDSERRRRRGNRRVSPLRHEKSSRPGRARRRCEPRSR